MALRIKPELPSTCDDLSDDEFPRRIVLDDASFDALCELLANPPEPTEKLRALFHKKK